MRHVPLVALAAFLAGAATPAAAADAPKKGTETAAAKSPQATAYRAWVKAVKTGNYEAWKKVVPAEAPKQMEEQAKQMGKQPKDVLELLAAMTPDEHQFRDVKVDGDKATLRVIGRTKGETEPTYVSVEMVRENGAWKVGQQSASNVDK